MLRGPRFRYFMQALRQQREDLIACGYPVPAIPENNLEPAVPLMSIGDGIVYPSRQGTIFASLTDALMTDGYLLEVGQKLLGRIQRPDPDVGPCLGTGWSKRLRDHDPDPLDGTPYISAEVAWALWLPEFPEAPDHGGILPVKRKRDFSQLTDELLDEHTTRFELAGQGRTLHQRGVRARDARAAIEGYTPDPNHLRHQSGGDVAALGYIKRILKVLTVYEAMPEAERNLLAGMYPDDVELQLEWVPGSAIRHGWRALMEAMDQRTRRYIEFEAEVRKWEDLQSARPKVKARRTAAAASTDTGGGIGAMNEGSETGAMNEGSETESAESSSASSSDESIPMGEYMMQSRTRVLALIEAEKALKDVGSSAPLPPSPIIMEPSPVATDGYKFDPASLGAPLGDTAAPSTPVPPSPSAVSLAPLESFKFLDVPPVASSGPSDHSVEPMVVEEERAPETPGPTASVGAPISATESVPETPPPGEIPGPGYVPKLSLQACCLWTKMEQQFPKLGGPKTGPKKASKIGPTCGRKRGGLFIVLHAWVPNYDPKMGPKLGPQKWVQNCSCNHSCKFHGAKATTKAHTHTHTHTHTHRHTFAGQKNCKAGPAKNFCRSQVNPLWGASRALPEIHGCRHPQFWSPNLRYFVLLETALREPTHTTQRHTIQDNRRPQGPTDPQRNMPNHQPS